MKFIYVNLIIISVICFVFVRLNSAQETEVTKNILPQISKVAPTEIFPGMALKIEGYRLGINDSTKVIFIQNANEFELNPNGGSWEAANISQGLQELYVGVPEGLLSGKCQIIIEYNGQKSLPFELEVLPFPKPPKLSSIRPAFALPKELIFIFGSSFISGDIAELIDADGKKHIVNLSVDEDGGSFSLSDKLPDGLVTLKVIGNRGGISQESNPLTFKIKRAAVPLDFWEDIEESVALNQWFQPTFMNLNPLKKATKIEFLLRQGTLEQTCFVTDFRNILVQIPNSFSPGEVEIQNRVWKNQEASEWSKPLQYQIAENPAKTKIFSFIKIPLKAEAMFKQNEKIIEILPIIFKVFPEVPVSEKIKDGNLEVFTRFWKDGKFTDWELSRTLDFRKSAFAEDFFEFGNFTELFSIGNDSPDFFQINHGEILGIDGKYYVGAADELRITLENSGEKIKLKPFGQAFSIRLMVNLPRNLRSGDWSVSIKNLNNDTVVDIPVKLRIN